MRLGGVGGIRHQAALLGRVGVLHPSRNEGRARQRGVVEANYWKREIRRQIDRITVLNPVKFTSVRRNEVKEKIGAGTVAKVIDYRSFTYSTRA